MAEIILAPSASGIYEIVCAVNGKRYVGSAVNIAQRWRQHRCELGKGRHNQHMQNAWRKYGEAAFEFRIIELVPDKSLLVTREQHHIDTLKPEYNCARIAGSNLGITFGQAVLQNMSEASRRTWAIPGHRERMSLAHLGQISTPETRAKLSAALRGRKLSAEHAAIVAKNNSCRNRSSEHRALMSAYWGGRPKTDEQIAKMAATKRGRPLSTDHRQKLAETMRRAHAEGRHNYERTDELRKQIGRSIAKLTDNQVLAILEKWKRGTTQRELCATYGISQSAMSSICNRKTYGWVDTG